jgi:hypothetical protein
MSRRRTRQAESKLMLGGSSNGGRKPKDFAFSNLEKAVAKN